MTGHRPAPEAAEARPPELPGDAPLRYIDLVSGITADLPPLPIAALGEPMLKTSPPALAKATVMLITSAGVRGRDEQSFRPTNDMSFRRIEHTRASAELVPSHPTPVRRAAEADINVVLPRDRLDELVADGSVGARADFDLSFLGTIKTLTDLVLTMAPAMAAEVRAAGADVALLVPL